MSANLLGAETSPYLLQHKDNPVHWRPWGEPALAEARRLNRPILLSVGYSACHWCHVMAHESFESAEIAALMNDLFINIKVDREERPDVDTLYQSALALMGQQGGWPLTMFLTPGGEPFWGGTYFPPDARYGRPGFIDVLRQVASAWQGAPHKVQENVAKLRDALGQMAAPKAGAGLSDALLDEVAAAGLRLIDPIRGGTAGAPKFPQPVFFRMLWRAYQRTGAVMFREAVRLTLERICRGGICDHLGGGFARYATDVDWLVPHFEKMLYDNALLVSLMVEVWRETGDPLLASRIAETIDWVLADLRVEAPDGDGFALASAFDADSDGAEGAYYVWTGAEIDALLGADAPMFRAAYDITDGGNWEGRSILNRSGDPDLGTDEAREETLARCRRRLLEARRRRTPPGRDDKVLADWNGLMITALVDAAAAFDRPDWLAAARACLGFISRRLSDGDGRLRHVWCAGSSRHPAVLEDYANMARAAIALFEATGRPDDLDAAQRWVAIADRWYWDADGHGYFQAAADTADVFLRSKVIADHAVPSGNGVMLDVLARLYHLTGDGAYGRRAEALANLFSGDNAQYLLGIPQLLMGWELLAHAVVVVIIGPAGDPATVALHRAALANRGGTGLVALFGTDDTLPAGHPAFGKTAIDGRPTAYVCAGSTCSAPVTSVADLRRTLGCG
jgi:hypothetical protein